MVVKVYGRRWTKDGRVRDGRAVVEGLTVWVAGGSEVGWAGTVDFRDRRDILRRVLRDFAARGDIIDEGFLGVVDLSGSTLITLVRV